MINYIIRRLVQTAITTFIVVSLIFFLVHLLPGDPARTILGGMTAQPTAEQIAAVREQLGLDRPLHIQYLTYLRDLARADLGESLVNNRPVLDDILLRVPRTLQIAVPALILATIVGIPLGVVAARRRRRMGDLVISTISVAAFSLPSFVSGLLLVVVFSINLQWLPASGWVSPADDFAGFLSRIILPTIALAVAPAGLIMRMMRSSMLEQLGQDYATTARAKGLTDQKVVYGHVFRNSMMPVVTSLGLQAGFLFTGSVIVENVFNWPGIGNMLLDSVLNRDYPVIQGMVLVVSLAFVLINLITDLTYGLIDPRIRYD
ncbi:ABC transporter permease [Pseudoruegeria sp. HB172150]|uniref:ABC transporter permease n=1 Tax=Pseudoruegeria sp. HB172150 TaxID=2721164 RepID=UPI001554068F|nr:ABC transporter permease [Pseudoruegeria sp. HB172150]